MAENKDIRLEFHFKYEDRLPAGLFARFVQVAEQAIYEAELEDLFELSVTLPEISRIDLDAMRYRMDQNWGRTLQLEDVYTGSIILSGLAAGLAYWVVDQTLSESLQDGWPGSELRGRIRDHLLGDPLGKAQRVAAKIAAKAEEDLYLKQYETRVEHEVYEGGFAAVAFTIELAPEDQGPPARADLN